MFCPKESVIYWNMNKQVVFVTGSMRRGGAERVISLISNELINRGWGIHIITVLRPEIEYYLDSRIIHTDISSSNSNKVLDMPRIAKELRKRINIIKPDAVISFMMNINIVTWLAVRKINVKFIASERNDPSQGRSKIRHWLSSLAYASSYRTVFQTERARSFYSKKIQDKGIIICNPIKVECLCEKSLEHKIISVGRLDPQKNRRLLIEAFYEIHSQYPDYSLHIFGEGVQEQELKALVSSLGLTSSVVFHGNVNNVHQQIKNGEIFVLSSDFEGQSNALLEAMMMGFPCVSTDCAGAVEAINNGIDGFIVPIKDKDKMVEAISKLIASENLREQFSKNSIIHARQFDVKSVVDKWEELIK